MIYAAANLDSLNGAVCQRRFGADERCIRDRRVKRKVRIVILSYVGVVWNAEHYTPQLVVEENPLWVEAEKDYVIYRDDLAARGQQLTGPPFKSESKAQDWIRKTLREKFPRETYRYQYESRWRAPRWLFRQGD